MNNGKLAGINESDSGETVGSLAGIANNPVNTSGQLAGIESQQTIEMSGQVSVPLGPLADPTSLATRGLRVHSARKRSVIDRHPPMVGARAMFSIDFFDVVSKQAVSPTNVFVEIEHVSGGGTETIKMIENTGRIGYYTGSLIPSMSGEWNARAHYGDEGDIIDTTRFYVLPAQ